MKGKVLKLLAALACLTLAVGVTACGGNDGDGGDGGLTLEGIARENGAEPLDVGGLSGNQLLSEEIDLDVFRPYGHEGHDAGGNEGAELGGLGVFLVEMEGDGVVEPREVEHFFLVNDGGGDVDPHTDCDIV